MVVLTTFDVDSHVYEALRAGASGFLLKNAPPEDLVQAIRVVAAGAALLDPAVTRRVIEEFARNPTTGPPTAEVNRLTDRELEVLHQVARGLSTPRSPRAGWSARPPSKPTSHACWTSCGYATPSKPSSTPTKTDSSDPVPDQEDHRDRRSVASYRDEVGLTAT